MTRSAHGAFAALTLLTPLIIHAQGESQRGTATTIEIPFQSHDGHRMLGKLTIPTGVGRYPVVIYAQSAEGMTVDMKRRLSDTATFNYFDLYATKLPEMNVAFFRYEGRGIRNGSKPPRFEEIDTAAFNTGTLENKVHDLISALRVMQQHASIDTTKIVLMGASEGTLLIAEAAARVPSEVAGLVMYGVLAEPLRETFRYIMSEGAFLPYRRFFDSNKDGRVTQTEFEADPRKYRERVLRKAPFSWFDKNQDSVFTVDDMRPMTKTYLDAIEGSDYDVLTRWARTSAAVATPNDWFQDHFTHAPMRDFLAKLDIPIGLFQGDFDTNTPIGAVRELELWAKEQGKGKMRFHYFEGLDHSLNIGQFFARGTLPAGHEAIFAYLRNQIGTR
jgi:pimeloyl-ACP methyl ester carboxylesterase